MALSKVGAQAVMGPLLPRVADQIKEAISVKGRARPNCPEALQCVGVLAQALGPVWKAEATSLVPPMMSTGLSQPLVKTLQVKSCITAIHFCSQFSTPSLIAPAQNPPHEELHDCNPLLAVMFNVLSHDLVNTLQVKNCTVFL